MTSLPLNLKGKSLVFVQSVNNVGHFYWPLLLLLKIISSLYFSDTIFSLVSVSVFRHSLLVSFENHLSLLWNIYYITSVSYSGFFSRPISFSFLTFSRQLPSLPWLHLPSICQLPQHLYLRQVSAQFQNVWNNYMERMLTREIQPNIWTLLSSQLKLETVIQYWQQSA